MHQSIIHQTWNWMTEKKIESEFSDSIKQQITNGFMINYILNLFQCYSNKLKLFFSNSIVVLSAHISN